MDTQTSFDRLVQLRAHLDGNPDYKQHTYAKCVANHACRLFKSPGAHVDYVVLKTPLLPLSGVVYYSVEEVHDGAQRLLGLTKKEADKIFLKSKKRNALKQLNKAIARREELLKPTPAILDEIDNFELVG